MTAKLIAITSKVLLSLLLAVIVGALAVVTVIPRAVHGAALTVLTGSMTPTIPVGSVVVVRPVDPGTLHVGDIITFQKKPAKAEFITHRIVSIHTDTKPVTLTTKGDANRGQDANAVPVTAVRGRVLFHVPYLGTLRSAISTGGAGMLLLLVGLVAYALTQLTAGLRERRGEVRVDPSISQPAPASSGLTLQLLVVTLPVTEFEGLLPYQVAQLLRMDLLDESADQFSLAIAREPEQVTELSSLLMMFKPISLERSDAVTVPFCRAAVSDVHEELEPVGGAHARA